MQVYLDNAATTRADIAVIRKMNDIQNNIYANASSTHKQGRIAFYETEKARQIIAEYIGALPEQVLFTSGGTESDNWALKGCFEKNGFNNRLAVSKAEHHAVLHCADYLHGRGAAVLGISVDINGNIDAASYERAMTERPLLTSVMTANNETGNIYDTEKLCLDAHKNGSYFHTDAVSAFGKVPTNVRQTDVDLMSVSAHKFHGPKGIGFLYVKDTEILSPFMHGGAQEGGMRAGTYNTAAIAGMAEAVRLLNEEGNSHLNEMARLKEMLKKGLKENIDEVYFNGSDNTLCCILSVTFPDVSSQELMLRLNKEGIYVSAAAACGANEPSHVLAAMGKYKEFDEKGAPYATVRFSLGRYTTQEEIAYTIDKTARIIENLKNKGRSVI